ncbi:BQ5605_C011g06378 [Microbotryum silenes-dioicae]|uniref:BQ5605_C011g06378 protein n=1 Tax=Microbotryum silenes-dioicae TaxID=796604 RepID=A0A2X0NRP0_9BASI|nr:BQ5605_C011g06378 [Microbotryum silenes-dioicae]
MDTRSTHLIRCRAKREEKTQFATRGIRPIKFYSGTLVLARTPHRPPRLLAAPSNYQLVLDGDHLRLRR